MPPETNGWNEWSRHVLAELERLDGDIKDLNKKTDDNKDSVNKKVEDKCSEILKEVQSVKDLFTEKVDNIKGQVIALKIKVALIGGFAGLIVSALITLLVRFLTK